MNRLSVVVVTKNEEKNLPRCLESVNWADEIVVVDSESTDRTLDIAKQFGANIYRPEWRGFGPAKRAGVRQAKGEWILSIDADEVITPELSDEVRTAVQNDSGIVGFHIPRRTQFLGRWIYHCGWYPGCVLRLFRKANGDFDDAMVHEKVTVDGPTARLKEDILHYSFPTIDSYLAKTRQYSSLSAKEAYLQNKKSGAGRIVGKTVASFIRHYIIKRGFLDGTEGFTISVLASCYTLAKYVKLRELTRQGEGQKGEETAGETRKQEQRTSS